MTATRQATFRLPTHLIKQLDAYAKAMREKQPGLIFTRADAVRTILSKVLSDPSAMQRDQG